MENVVTCEIIPTSRNEEINLNLIENYNNLIDDTVDVLYEFIGENAFEFRKYIKYGFSKEDIQISYPNLNQKDVARVCHILQIFEGRIFDLCKQIKLQVFKGAMNDYALELIREWEKFPSSFPLSN